MDYDINGTLNVEVLNKLKDNLYDSSGFKGINTDNESNIVSTYALYKLNTISTDNKYILDNVLFVNSFKVDEGIYAYSISDRTVNLITIWYGNIIANTKAGVQNDDTKNWKLKKRLW